MEIVTEEPLNILSQLVIPIFLLAVSGVIPAYITKYSKKQDKTQYIRFLRTNFSTVEAYLIAIQDYKARRLGTAPMCLVLGIIIGIFFGLVMDLPVKGFLQYTSENILKKYFLVFYNNLTNLNLVLFYYSCLYIISILIIFMIWFGWCELLKKTKLAEPKITRNYPKNPKILYIPSIKNSSDFVYLSLWSFIGTIIGFNLLIFAATLGMFIKFSIFPDNFSFNWVTFTNIYASLETAVAYLKYYEIIFLIGIFLSLINIIMIYNSIRWFSTEVKRLITNFFKYDFPEVKITTENNEIKGKLNDVLSKTLVTVSEKNMIKMVPWDKIETMEASKIDKKFDKENKGIN